MGRTRKVREWIGGVVPMPGYVTGDGEPYRPDTLLWLSPEGAVLGTALLKPGEAATHASTSLREAMERPMWGTPETPTRVRVASRALAEAVRQGHPGLEVVCAPTPELDEVAASMREHFTEQVDVHPSYLKSDATPEAVGAFFRAAATLYRAQPWTVVPGEGAPILVTIETLGVREAAVSIIGQMGESFGFLLFEEGLEAFDAFADAGLAVAAGKPPQVPRHVALTFEPLRELEADPTREIAEHGWEVAGPGAYPWAIAVEKDLLARTLTPRELRVLEAVALAIPEFLDTFTGEAPPERTLRVTTHAGEVEVLLQALEIDEDEEPSGFGFLDALIEAGRAEGFDVNTRPGLEAWLREAGSRPVSAELLPFPFGQAPRTTRPKAKAKAKTKTKTKTKTKKQSRKPAGKGRKKGR